MGKRLGQIYSYKTLIVLPTLQPKPDIRGKRVLHELVKLAGPNLA